MFRKLFFILFAANAYLVECQNEMNRYKTIKDHRIQGNAFTRLSTRSRLECTTKCSENKDYKKPKCALFTTISPESIVSIISQSGYTLSCKYSTSIPNEFTESR